MNYQTIKVRFQSPICFIQFNRPEANNTINDLLIAECHQVLDQCEESITIVVFEGLPEVFCFGADFQQMHRDMLAGKKIEHGPESLYNLWLKIAEGPYVTISHVKGKVNAGGVGFVAASDISLADKTASFSLSELLFGVYPACVLPFLVRRIGFQKAHYLTLMTQPVNVQEAHTWGLIDAHDPQSDSLLRKHLLRLKRLSKIAISRYKSYMSGLCNSLTQSRSRAVAGNLEVFSDPKNLEGIFRYVDKGIFPWEDLS